MNICKISLVRKSFTIEVSLETTDPKVSPMIDLDRVNAIFNQIELTLRLRIMQLTVELTPTEDPSAATYVTKIIKLEKGSDNLESIL